MRWIRPKNNPGLVGGWPTPLKNMSESQLGWWHSQLNGKSFKIPWFQTTQIRSHKHPISITNYFIPSLYHYWKTNAGGSCSQPWAQKSSKMPNNKCQSRSHKYPISIHETAPSPLASAATAVVAPAALARAPAAAGPARRSRLKETTRPGTIRGPSLALQKLGNHDLTLKKCCLNGIWHDFTIVFEVWSHGIYWMEKNGKT